MTYPDILNHFSWTRYAVAAAIYTLALFAGRTGGAAFSKRNSVPPLTILRVHMQYLATLLVLFWGATMLYPNLPDWTKEHFSARGSRPSAIDMLFYLVVFVMLFAEHRVTYIRAQLDEGEQP
jgi:hypothetical protein